MKIGEEFEFDNTKTKNEKEKNYNGSDEDATLAQAYTRFDNDCPD